MAVDKNTELAASAVLIVDGDIVSRHVISNYLRHCGYAVIEAANTDEAYIALGEESLSIDVILCDVSAIGSKSAHELASWIKANRPELEVQLAGDVEGAANTAAELCEAGPQLKRPYEPESVVEYIQRLRASRKA